MSGPRIGRRSLLRRAAAGAVLLAGGTTGCAPVRPGAAAPGTQAPVRTVPFQLYFPFPFSASNEKLVQGFVDREFNAKQRGLRAVWQPAGNMSAVAGAILAGSPAPVVVSSCCGDWPVIAPFLEPLDAYFKKDNLDVAKAWTARQLAQFQGPAGLLGLPEDAATQAYVYRQDILDGLGLSYPTPDWTYQDAARLWAACAGNHGGQHRYGAALPWNPGGPFPGLALLHGFGGGLIAPDGTTCLLGSPGSIAAGEWVFHQVWSGVATNGDGVPVPGVKTGQVVFSQGADPSILWCVQNLTGGAKWDFLPFPTWPKRPATIFQSNFYAMNAFAPDREVAWELLRFAAVDTAWSRFYMHLTMAPPALLSLLPEWETLLRTVAPVLKNKALHYWTEPAVRGEGYDAFAFFKYDPTQIAPLIAQTWGLIWKQQTTVAAGFQAIAQGIDALQTAAAAGPPPPSAAKRVAGDRAAARAFPTAGPPMAAVTPGR